ncbi:ras-related protein Rap-1 [Aplysia californica]|uniref:Ras-related protein Rap-1 n=1 Tax=Aplysia californica TaxID=6500 RepID=A0ABM0JFL2_APLCA|nr:ras-related protein Rap-1 [Aplysia californica]
MFKSFLSSSKSFPVSSYYTAAAARSYRPTMSSKSTSSNRLSVTPTAKSPKSHYRLVVMGAAGVGKTAIISQFLYDQFVSEYKETIEELHRGEYDMNGVRLTLDILDTSGSHAFPAMRKLAIDTGDAFVLVYSVENEDSFQEVTSLRQQILDERSDHEAPIVIVANKTDVGDEKRAILPETAESMVCMDWGNGYVEASAKDNVNIVGIFKEILRQSKVRYELSPAVRRRRESMPSSSQEGKKKGKLAKRRTQSVNT